MDLFSYLEQNPFLVKRSKDRWYRLYFRVNGIKVVPWRILLTDFGRFLANDLGLDKKDCPEIGLLPMPIGEWFRAHPFIPWADDPGNGIDFTYVIESAAPRAHQILSEGLWTHKGFEYMGCVLDGRDPLSAEERNQG